MGQLLIVRKSGNKSKRISLLIYLNLINKKYITSFSKNTFSILKHIVFNS